MEEYVGGSKSSDAIAFAEEYRHSGQKKSKFQLEQDEKEAAAEKRREEKQDEKLKRDGKQLDDNRFVHRGNIGILRDNLPALIRQERKDHCEGVEIEGEFGKTVAEENCRKGSPSK